MRRRDLFEGAVAATILWLKTASAQKPMPVIGYLALPSRENFSEQFEIFREGLAAGGFVEGRNVTIVQRWADGDRDRLPALAGELVQMGVDVIATTGGLLPPRAAASATSTIPIVASSAVLLVDSIARPAGNVTGAGTRSGVLIPKRLELLHAAVPRAEPLAVLNNPDSFLTPETGAATAKLLAETAESLGVRLDTVDARRAGEFDEAFARIGQSGAGGLLVMPDPLFYSWHRKIVELANRQRLPAIYEWHEMAQNGGLMAYGDSVRALNLRVGEYVGRILKGATPRDLPVDLPSAIRLTLNLRTAKAIGFTFPQLLLARADEVIE
jgi:putative ABC transport system substrate-binding protein